MKDFLSVSNYISTLVILKLISYNHSGRYRRIILGGSRLLRDYFLIKCLYFLLGDVTSIRSCHRTSGIDHQNTIIQNRSHVIKWFNIQAEVLTKFFLCTRDGTCQIPRIKKTEQRGVENSGRTVANFFIMRQWYIAPTFRAPKKSSGPKQINMKAEDHLNI